MKTILLGLSLCLTITLLGNTNKNSLLIDQLTEVNKYWLTQTDAIADGIPAVDLSETKLIQLHLHLVEKTLRGRNISHLKPYQQRNRTIALDILHGYWEQGVFPQNIFHDKRTPYFIDHLNTACAVGYLIIQTGYEDLAHQIAAENNYAYIDDMDYPRMKQWADEFGFTLEELKWIQPAYSCSYCAPDTVLHVSSCGAADGCIGLETVDFSVFNPDLIFTYDKVMQYNASLNTWIEPHPSYNLSCDLTAGYFKLIFQDQFKANYEFFYTLFEPEPLISDYEVTHGNQDCSGTIRASVSGGQPPYLFTWSTGINSWIITDLCEGEYYVTVEDANECDRVDTVHVSFQTNTEDISSNDIRVFPNPVTDILNVELLSKDSDVIRYDIMNSLGVKVYSGELTSQDNRLDVSFLARGIYFLLASNDERDLLTRFVKAK